MIGKGGIYLVMVPDLNIDAEIGAQCVNTKAYATI